MAIGVLLMGILIAGAGAFGLVRPTDLIAYIASWQPRTRLVFAVGVRFVVGLYLIWAAPACRASDAVFVFGVIALAAAIVLLLMGPKRLEKFVGWWLRQSPGVIRISAGFAFAFGLFFIYAGTA